MSALRCLRTRIFFLYGLTLLFSVIALTGIFLLNVGISQMSINFAADWLLLEYKNGAQYGSHCGKEPRRARIMIMCDKSVSIGVSMVQSLV